MRGSGLRCRVKFDDATFERRTGLTVLIYDAGKRDQYVADQI